MSADFTWLEDNGAAAGAPPKGTTRTDPITNLYWKSVDDATTLPSAAKIQRGNNSYDVWIAGHFSGTYTDISAGLWAHTAGAFGAGLTLKGVVGATYTTPAASANANLTTDMTAVIAIGAGAAVQFGPTGPEAAGKAASTTDNPAYTQWLPTQLQTTVAASPGAIGPFSVSLQYDES